MLVLYIGTLSIDAIRKITGLPTSAIGIIYVITAFIYLKAIPGGAKRSRPICKTLPLWLFLLSFWCLVVALVQHIPPEVALLGWASYVFFVPLVYIGSELMEDETTGIIVLRLVAICGAVIGVTAAIGAIMGSSAPALLQPIIPTVGYHAFNDNSVFLAPSFFADAEEASEQLLVSFFAWVALMYVDNGRFRRMRSAVLGALIIGGLLFTARRAELYVVVIGITVVVILDHLRAPASARVGAFRVHLRMRGGRMRSGLGLTAFLAGLGSICLMLLLGGEMLGSFLVSGSAGARIFQMFSFADSGSVIGQGTGTSTQGITVLGSTPTYFNLTTNYVMNGRIFITVEGGLGKTWLELGVMGLVLYGAVFLSALSPAILLLRRLDGVGAALLVLVGAVIVIFLKNHQSLDDPLIQPLFWLAVGGIWGRMRAVSTTAH